MSGWHVPVWAWAGFLALVAALLVFDLGLAARKPMTPQRSLSLAALYIAVALGFGGGIWLAFGNEAVAEYLSAYVTEYSLSLDNIFMFLVLFRAFSIPDRYHHKVLFWGIIGALLLRGLLIAAGLSLIARFGWVLDLFALFLIWSGGHLLLTGGAQEAAPREGRVYRFVTRHLPLTDRLADGRFFTRENGRRCGTLLLTLVIVIECTDLVFAFDSVPAVFSITRNAFIALTSNIFAIVGLRALYFALRHVVERFTLLEKGLSLVLVLVGLKILAANVVALPVWLPAAMAVTVIAGCIVLSLARGERTQREPG